MKNLKRLLSVMLVCAMILAIVPAFTASAGDKVQIKIDTVDAKAGDKGVEVKVFVTEEPHFGAIQLEFSFDASKLTYKSWTFNAEVNEEKLNDEPIITAVNKNDAATGSVIVSLASSANCGGYEGYYANGADYIGTFKFDVAEGVKGLCDVDAVVSKLSSATGDVQFEFTKGGVNVKAEPCDPANHQWKETSRVDSTETAAGVIYYECEICGETKEETIDPKPPVAKAEIKIETVNAKAGDKGVEVKVFVTEEPHFGAIQLEFSFDASKLTYKSWTFNAEVNEEKMNDEPIITAINKNDAGTGSVIVSLASSANCGGYEGYYANGADYLGTFKFDVAEGVADGLYDIDAVVSKLSDASGDIPFNFTKGGINIAACDHNWVDNGNKKDATCEEDGYIEYECDKCHQTKQETQTRLGHDFGEWVQTQAPTCQEEGVETRTCKRDSSHTETRAVPVDPDAHNLFMDGHKDPTCDEDGYSIYHCTNGACDFEKTEKLDRLGHDFGEWTQTKAPSCTEKGEETRTCKRDSSHVEKRDIDIDPNAHDWDEWKVTTPATCEADGEETRVCKNDDTHTETRVITGGHDWDEWKETKPATCDDDGEETRVCKNDDTHTETRPITKLGHDWGEWVETKAPTCTEKGVETRTCKRDSSHVEKRDVDIDPDAHTWGEWKETKPATENEDGSAERICEECGEKETKVIPKTGSGEEEKKEDDKKEDGKKDKDNTKTGDYGIPAIVLVALIASAAVVVISRKKRFSK